MSISQVGCCLASYEPRLTNYPINVPGEWREMISTLARASLQVFPPTPQADTCRTSGARRSTYHRSQRLRAGLECAAPPALVHQRKGRAPPLRCLR